MSAPTPVAGSAAGAQRVERDDETERVLAAGHDHEADVHLEQPDVVTDAIVRFVKDQGGMR
jgi:hypothetical protein